MKHKMQHSKRNRRIARLPAGQAIWAMLAGELFAHALLGMFEIPELLLFAATLAAGLAAGILCSRRAPGEEGAGKRPRLPGAADGSAHRPQREEYGLPSDAARRGQDQRQQAVSTLAAQLEADARRLLSQEAALQGEWARREQALQSFWKEIQKQAGSCASEARQLAEKEADAAQQAAGEWERARAGLSQELGQVAFLANQLALRLQQAPQVDEKSAAQAAAEGLQLLAARCGRCGKRLAGEQGNPSIGQVGCAGQAQLAEFLQGLQLPQAAKETGGQAESLRRTAGEIAGQARALIGMLQERKAPASRTGSLREGAIEGTNLRYRLVE